MTETETLKAESAAKDKKIAELQARLENKGDKSTGGEFAKAEKDLTELLMGGPKVLSKLPAALQEPRFLLYMVKSGQVEFGRPPHSFNAEGKLMPADGEWSWTGCGGRAAKALPDLLAEEQKLAAADKLERVALIPKDFGGEAPRDRATGEPLPHKEVPVSIRLHVRLAARQ